jgi:hypothetical protein
MKGQIMRSDLVFEAELQVANRFLLATIAMRVAQKLHISSNATEHTVNQVFADIAKGRFTDAKLPPVVQLPPIDLPLNVYAA